MQDFEKTRRESIERRLSAKPNIGDWKPFESKLGLVRLILCVVWDPISVFGHASTLNEYDSYAARVLKAAEFTKTPELVAALLRQFEEDSIGMSRDQNGEARLPAATKSLRALARFGD